MSDQPHILMVIESSRESGRQLIAGITDYARHFGPWRFDWHPQGLDQVAARPEQSTFDGILVRDVADVQALVEAGIPSVAFTYGRQHIADMGWACTNNTAISGAVANHFMSRGFRHFAFLGYEGLPWSEERRDCFRSALAAEGFAADAMSIPRRGELNSGERVARWLRRLERPVALMTANDELGQWGVRLCLESGLRVPDDCAICGVDNDPVVCGVCSPPLSSIGIDQYQSGYRAAALLDKMMKGEVSGEVTIAADVGELMVRQSSDLFAVEDDAVAKALRFMTDNAYRPVSVDEVARASGMYRRGLERRFHQHLSRTVNQYFRDVRAEHIAKILRESVLSLEEIAEQCDFAQASHLTRFFSAVRGETPSAYRKRTAVK